MGVLMDKLVFPLMVLTIISIIISIVGIGYGAVIYALYHHEFDIYLLMISLIIFFISLYSLKKLVEYQN